MPAVNIQEDREKLFRQIKDEAFFKEKVTLSSGKQSDYYIDARRVTLTSQGVTLCARLFLEMIKAESFVAVGGPTMGADPILGAMAVISLADGKPLQTFIVRKKPKAYGKQQQIEGPLLSEGSQVILIDDVATTGKAFLESIDCLEGIGVRAPKAFCVVDRQEGAAEALAAKGCQLTSIFTAEEFLRS